MVENSNLKMKTLYIIKILLEKTDENNYLTVNDIISELVMYGITAERKSVYTDIELLKNFGMDIICERGRANRYFVGSREFELPELKLLVDAVQSSKFITRKKSEILIKKIEKLTSVYKAKELNRQILVADRVKTMNESIYYNVDVIHSAIRENKQVTFKYFEYSVDKKLKFRRNGTKYVASPYALTWAEENYYLIAYYDRYSSISNFRVDRMVNIEVSEDDRFFSEEMEDFNLSDYIKKTFNMFSGDTKKVELQFDNSLVNVVFDKFGKDICIYNKTEDHFCVIVDITISSTFLGWLFMFGDKVKIISPVSLQDKMKETAKDVLNVY